MSRKRQPPPFSEELARCILARVTAGETVSAICGDPGMPDYSTLVEWLGAHPDFRDRYLDAHQQRADALADEVLQVIRSEQFSASDKQVRIKGLMWAVDRAGTRATDADGTPRKPGTRSTLPFGAHPAEPDRPPGKSD